MRESRSEAKPGEPAVDGPPASLAEAWSIFLSRYTWDWFCTFTFREPTHPEAAAKAFRYFTNELNKRVHGRNWQKRQDGGVYWVRALEWQRRDVLHYHALMGDVEDLNARTRRLEWMDWWNLPQHFGFAKIELPIARVAVANYVSKYVTKGGEVDVSDNLRSYAEQISAVPYRQR